ncbi:MAG TPA: hypothetical protein VJL83_02275 [Patescibacteria group bacterium]|nr:hypothetical protein [Patescibacteria group bacterium]
MAQYTLLIGGNFMVLEREILAKIIRNHWSVTEAFTGYVLALEETKVKAEAKKEALIEQALRSRREAEEKIESENLDQRIEGNRNYRLSYSALLDLKQVTVDFIHEGKKYPVKNPYGFHSHSENDGTHGSELKSPDSFANQDIALRPNDIIRGTNHNV